MTTKKSAMTAIVIGLGLPALGPLVSPAAVRATAALQEGAALAPGELNKSGGILCKDAEHGGTGCRDSLEATLAKRVPQGPVPRTPWDGKPDFNGVYYPTVTIAPAPVALASLFRREAQPLREKRAPLDPDATANMHCWPQLLQGGITGPHPSQLVQAPGIFMVMNDYLNHYRIIPTDGRPHNPAHRPSFQGDSVGHWEGDTLVVDVTNFNGKAWLGGGRPPIPTSDKLHIVERWTRPDAQTIEYQAVIEDPIVLTGPWITEKLRRGRLPYDMIQEAVCVEEFARTDARESDADLEKKGLRK